MTYRYLLLMVLAFLATPFVFFYALFVEIKYQPANAGLTIALFIPPCAMIYSFTGPLAVCIFLYCAGFAMVNWLHGDELTFIRNFGQS